MLADAERYPWEFYDPSSEDSSSDDNDEPESEHHDCMICGNVTRSSKDEAFSSLCRPLDCLCVLCHFLSDSFLTCVRNQIA